MKYLIIGNIIHASGIVVCAQFGDACPVEKNIKCKYTIDAKEHIKLFISSTGVSLRFQKVCVIALSFHWFL